MTTAWIQRTAIDTAGELTTYFHPTNLTSKLTLQSGKDFVWNGVLCTAAWGPGYLTSYVTSYALNSVNIFAKIPVIQYISKLAIRVVSFSAGLYANYWIVKNILPLPTAMSGESAIKLYCLVAIGSIFIRSVVGLFTAAKVSLTLSPELNLAAAAFSGCFRESSLFVVGAIGAAQGALA